MVFNRKRSAVTRNPSIMEGSKGYLKPEYSNGGYLGNELFWETQHCANLVRHGIDLMPQCANLVSTKKVKLSSPTVSSPIALTGVSLFGPPNFTSLSHNMSYDLRGEAVRDPYRGVSHPPIGASQSALVGGVINTLNTGTSFGCKVV